MCDGGYCMVYASTYVWSSVSEFLLMFIIAVLVYHDGVDKGRRLAREEMAPQKKESAL